MRLLVTIALSAFLLTGCASAPTPQEIQSADYGASVYQADAENSVKNFFNTRLKDPESAKYYFGSVGRGYIVGSRIQGRKLEAGYLLDVSVNAKNSYGGYTGAKPYKFLFRNDQVVQVLEIQPSGMQWPLL
jgi:PBP1b-binding outer membrane lipoprotein LpoB